MGYANKEEFEKIKQLVKEKELKKIDFYNGEECKALVEIGKDLAKTKPLPKIAYCFMTLNRYDEMVQAIRRVITYVDKIIAVDGGSVDNTIEYLQNIDKCDIVRRKWDDQFDVQRNQYINHALKNYPDHWVLVSDTDEHFSKELMENLKYIILAVDKMGINRLGFLSWFKMIACPGSTKTYDKSVEMQLKSKHYTKCFYKKLCFKVQEGVQYVKSPHEGLLGNWKILNLCHPQWYFEHIKTRKSEVERGTRNYFVAGPSMKKDNNWQNFRSMVSKYGWKIWSDMSSAMIQGDLPEDVLKWIWSRKDWQEDGPPSSEQREYWMYYYDFLHPHKIEEDKKRYLK